LKETFFGLDKDFWFGGIVSYMKLYFGPLANVGYTSNSNAGPSASGTVAQLTGNVNIGSTLQLYLAVETNEQIVNGFKAKVNSGFMMAIPYVQDFKNSNQGTFGL